MLLIFSDGSSRELAGVHDGAECVLVRIAHGVGPRADRTHGVQPIEPAPEELMLRIDRFIHWHTDGAGCFVRAAREAEVTYEGAELHVRPLYPCGAFK